MIKKIKTLIFGERAPIIHTFTEGVHTVGSHTMPMQEWYKCYNVCLLYKK